MGGQEAKSGATGVVKEGARCVRCQKSQGKAQGAPNPASRDKMRNLPENSCSGQGEARPGDKER